VTQFRRVVERPRGCPPIGALTSPAAHRRGIAHPSTVLAKRKSGRIDVYFVGDSITRRWGTVTAWKAVENWNANFRGQPPGTSAGRG
jgi:hypothetical protein